MTTTIELIKYRKVCTNCKMNALFTNNRYELANYGSTYRTEHAYCENCGHIDEESK